MRSSVCPDPRQYHAIYTRSPHSTTLQLCTGSPVPPVMPPSVQLLQILRLRSSPSHTLVVALARSPAPKVLALSGQLDVSGYGTIVSQHTLSSIRSTTCFPTTGNILNV